MCVAMAACASSSRLEDEPANGPAAPGAVRPLVRGQRQGLEVHWWVAADADGAVGSAIARAASRGMDAADAAPAMVRGLSPAAADAWNRNGLRLVPIPLGAVDALRSELPAIRTSQRAWMDWGTEWSEVLRGRRMSGRDPVLVDGASIRVGPGTLRLLARCWPLPGEPDAGPRMQASLAVQLHEFDAMRDVDPFMPRPAEETWNAVDQGPIFEHMMAELMLRPGWAYVVTAEQPGREWTVRAPPSPAAAAEDAPVDGAILSDADAASGASHAEPFGPPAAAVPTLGEAMLTGSVMIPGGTDGAVFERVPVKVVLVIVPRVNERFQLLP